MELYSANAAKTVTRDVILKKEVRQSHSIVHLCSNKLFIQIAIKVLEKILSCFNFCNVYVHFSLIIS